MRRCPFNERGIDEFSFMLSFSSTQKNFKILILLQVPDIFVCIMMIMIMIITPAISEFVFHLAHKRYFSACNGMTCCPVFNLVSDGCVLPFTKFLRGKSVR